MEVFVLIYIFIIFGLSCLTAGCLQGLFSRYSLCLIVIYIILIGIVFGIISEKYRQLSQLPTVKIPFTRTSDLSFTFVPQKTGDYSVDLTFLNKEVNRQVEPADSSGKNTMKKSARKR